MISRHWLGLAKPSFAQAYVEHLERDTFPAIRRLPGFVSASILRRDVAAGVEFLIVTGWETMTSIRAFAGENIETAVVPANVQAMMIEYDHTVRHYDVVD